MKYWSCQHNSRNSSPLPLSLKHRRFLVSLFLGFIIIFLYPFSCSEAPDSQNVSGPNILLITADDLGFQLGCYGDSTARTPNLDRLAAQGVRFENAYTTQSSCSPSRSSLFTGLYPHQNGQIGLAHTGYKMRKGIPTMPRILKKAGYQTGVIGKVHVAPSRQLPFDWCKISEDCSDRNNPKFLTRDIKRVAQYAGKFMSDAQERPFFLMVNYFDPHRPFVDKVEDIPEKLLTSKDVELLPFMQSASSQEKKDQIASYYNCISRLDAGIGLLMNKLIETGKEQNTIVIFLSDHGPPFYRSKITCYEAGVHIPLMIRWPTLLPEGYSSRELVSIVDILPTIMDAVGIKSDFHMEGASLLKLFHDESFIWRQTLITEFTSHMPKHYNPIRAIRGHRFKYILNLHPDVLPNKKEELYDLQEDPFEFHNLAKLPGYLKIKNGLSSQLIKWREITSDNL